MTVRKLSSYVRSQLQSGLTITDATQCVLELVENSLDAEATAIAVRVNLSEFTIEVVDNGTGISPQDLKLIGKRYMTSKLQNFDELNKSMITYGYKGQALASIAEICGKVSIKTRYKMNKETMIKIFRNGESPSLFVSSKDRSDKGTTVTVDGFMFTMPVRRKRIFEVFDLEDIKNQMEYLAIIHNEVCFTLRDENKGKILLQTHKKMDPGLSLRELFGLASDKFFIPFNYKEKNIVIEGHVSLIRHSESNLKFLYVNNRIVLKSMVHKLVDLCIDKYFKDNSNAPQEIPGFEGINLNLPKDNHNVYIVKIFCPYTYFVMFRNLRKTTVEFRDWDVILSCIKRALKTALYLKSPASESDKIDKIPACLKRVTYRNEQAVGNLNCGIKGGLVKRKLPCRSTKKERTKENPRRPTEGPRLGQNNYSKYNALSKSELVNNQTSTPHEYGHVQAPNILSESPVRGENYLNAKDKSAPSYSTESVPARKIKNTECADFLDFLAWFRSRLKDDSEIYNDFVKHRHNFQNRGIKNCVNEVGRKLLKNNKSLANKTKYKGVHKRKEEGNRKKEIQNSKLVRRSRKTGNSVVMKPLENDRIKGVKAMKRSNRARHSVELASKILKVGEVGNNSSEDLVLSESQNIPRNTLPGCWFSHRNRINLVDNDDMQISTHSKLNIDESKENKKLCKNKSKFKLEETQALKNVGKCLKDNAGEINLEYKDFGVQTDKALVITPSNNKPNTRHLPAPNSIPNRIQYDTKCSLKNKEPDGSVNIELPGKHTSREAGVFSSPRPSLQLNSLETIKQQFIAANENTETMSVNDSRVFDNRPSNKLSRGTASEVLNDFAQGTNFDCGTRLKLVHTDPLNFTDFNRGNGRTVSLGRRPCQSKFTFTDRYNFMPKGLSQSAICRSPIDHSKKQEDNDLVRRSSPFVSPFSRSGGLGHKSMLPCSIFGELQEKTKENMIYYEKELITVNLINNEAELSSLGTVTINKEGLSNITVLGQWDKKFILAKVDVVSSKMKKFLAVFDQHAVDERILLEKLLKEFRTSDGRFVSVCFDPPIKCIVKESVARSVTSFEAKLLDYGIKASVVDRGNVLLHEIPLCFADDNILEKAESFFQKLLSSLVEEFNETRGAGAAIPKAYYDVISTKACRNAVKFNDVLSNSAMKKMMSDLVKCKIPFQCAHGRPCIFPILDIEDYKRQIKFKKQSSIKGSTELKCDKTIFNHISDLDRQ